MDYMKTLNSLSPRAQAKFITAYLNDLIAKYKASDNEDMKYIVELLDGAKDCETGNVKIYLPYKTDEDENYAKKIADLIWDELSDMLLDLEMYSDNDEYCIDVMFGGAYVPYWDERF